MVNAYICYCRYLKDIDDKLMSRYMLLKMIAHAWMEKNYHNNTKKKEDKMQEMCSLSILSKTTMSTTTTRSRVSNITLNQITGIFKCRINNSLGHLPITTSRHHIKKSKCQLCYWATGKRKYINFYFVNVVRSDVEFRR